MSAFLFPLQETDRGIFVSFIMDWGKGEVMLGKRETPPKSGDAFCFAAKAGKDL